MSGQTISGSEWYHSCVFLNDNKFRLFHTMNVFIVYQQHCTYSAAPCGCASSRPLLGRLDPRQNIVFVYATRIILHAATVFLLAIHKVTTHGVQGPTVGSLCVCHKPLPSAHHYCTRLTLLPLWDCKMS